MPKSWWIMALIAYLLAVNLAGFCLMGMDKRRAKLQARRIRERTLFFVALIGGAVGSWAGMYAFHHKTKHARFVWGIPAILILQFALVIWLF